VKGTTFGDRAFSAAVSRVRNYLPPEPRTAYDNCFVTHVRIGVLYMSMEFGFKVG